jgi:YHS domain-containing protein
MTIRKSILILAPILMLALLTGALAAPVSRAVGDAYPLTTCPVSGGKLGSMGTPVVFVHEGREIRFCCTGCLPKFKSDPAKFLTKIDAAIVKAQKSLYPLKTCVVSGKSITGDVKPVEHIYGNRLVRLLDRESVVAFAKAPRKYMAKLDRAVVAAQKAAYPLTTCVVSGGKLGSMGAAVNYVHAGRLVRFCCSGCIKSFRKDPLTALAKIDAAATPAVSASPASPAPKAGCGGCDSSDGCGSDGCGSKDGAGSGAGKDGAGSGGGCGGGGCGGK